MKYLSIDACKRIVAFAFLALVRPSALSKREWDGLGVVCTLLILCATTMPWNNFTGQAYWHKVIWLPFSDACWQGWFVSDVFNNLILFMPFGWCMVHAQRFQPQQNRLSRVVLLAVVLSFAGEFFQVFSLQRSPSMTDVCTNTFGAMIAALQAIECQMQERENRPFDKDIVIREPLQEVSIPVTTSSVSESPKHSPLSHL